MTAYVYREGCGWKSEPFEAESDEAAEAHVERTFRSSDNPDFDGDSAELFRVEADEDGEYLAGVCSFAGENMIEDWDGLR